MPTALEMISRSMRLIGALGRGETPTDDEQTDGLAALNAMMDSWDAQSLAVYRVQSESFTWTASQTSQTMGSGGDFNTTRPAEIVSMFQRVSNVDYDIQKADDRQYALIPAKSTNGTLIKWIYPEMNYPLVTLYAYPVPSANATVHITSWKALQSFSAATDALALPEGYEDAIVFNLAMRLAPEYQRPIPPEVVKTANSGMRIIKQRNNRIPNAVVEPALWTASSWDWRTG